MGNVQLQKQQIEKIQQKSKESNGSMDKDKIYRFFGIRLANEGDGYDVGIGTERHLKIQMNRNTEELQIEDYPQQPPSAASPRSTNVVGNSNMEQKCLEHPGTIAELHSRCHDMMPQPFEGFRLNMNRSLGNNIAMGHSLQVGTKPQISGCQFNASFTGERLHKLSGEAYPMIVGEVDAKGNLTGTLMHFVTPRIRCKATATVLDAQLQSSRFFVDYFGDDFSCTCVLSNIDVQQQQGVFVASFLQQVTPQLALGMDFIYQREDIVPGGQAALISGVARYQHDNSVWSAMLSLHSLELCYSQLYGKSLGASVQLTANILKRQAISRLCYHCFIPQVGFSFRGGIDTRGVISAVCEKRLDPLPVLLQLSGKLNHLSNRFRFGLGLIVG